MKHAGWLALPLSAVLLALASAPSTGCAGDDCDPDTKTMATCGGELLDANTWESGPLDGTYLDFHGERTWGFNPSGWMGTREPAQINAYLSLNPAPNAPGGAGFAQSAGNLAEITVTRAADGFHVQVQNDTCAQYYLRLVITYAAADGGASPGTCTPGDAGR